MSSYSTFEYDKEFITPKITWGVQHLILITVGIFAIQLILDPVLAALLPAYTQPSTTPAELLAHWFGFQPGNFLRGQIWKPFTYMFLHGGLVHLFFNMLWLYIFGPHVERTLGTRQFYRFYIFCGALGVMANYLVLMNGIEPSVIGASGAAVGVLVASAMIDPDRQLFMIGLPFPINVRALVFFVVFLNVITALASNTNTSVATHFGGMGAAFLYMHFRPQWTRWNRARKENALQKPKSKSKKLKDTIGEQVDNILRFKDDDFKE